MELSEDHGKREIMRLINGIYHPESGHMLMISNSGSLKEVRPDMEQDLRGKGWKGVSNPKRSYYPEYDLSSGGRTPPDNITENLEESDILPGSYI